MRTFLMISLILFATTAESAITLSGKALLQGQTDNSGIKVRFTRTQPTTAVDSTITAADGSYSVTDSAGFYTISYFKGGYFVDSITEISYYSTTTISNQTLFTRTTRINVPAQFSTIQLAIDQAVDGDTILVAPGTYKENIVWNGENIVVASQILLTNDTSYIGRTIIDGNANGSVVTISGVSSANALLVGFTITNGAYSTYSPNYGAGINCVNSSLRMKHLNITGNSIKFGNGDGGGGGMALRTSSVTVDSVVFQNNSAVGPGGGCDWCGGEAIFFENDASTIQHARIINNSIIIVGSSPTFQQTVFTSFTSGEEPIIIAEGGASHFLNCEITKCQNTYQLVTVSGASAVFENMHIHDNVNVAEVASIYISNVTFKNVSIVNNSITFCGIFFNSHPCQVICTNCTFANNAISGKYIGNSYPAAFLYEDYGNATISISNCIFSRNDSIACRAEDGASSVTAQNNLFYNNSKGNFSNCGSYLGKNVTLNSNGDSADAYGNIQANPYFVNSDAGNYHLADWSRAIGAGTATGAPATDIEGTARGNPPDIGAYENARNSPIALPNPGVPLLAIPANNSVNIPVPILITWHPSIYAFSYRLQIFTDAGLSAKVFDTSGVKDTFVNFTSALNATKYYWQVNTTNTSGTSAWSSAWNFTTPTLAAPTLVSPSNNTANDSLNPVLAWNPISSAATYRIQSSTDSTFSTTLADDSTLTVTTKTISSLSTNTKYYWRVRAKNAGGVSQWSAVWHFTTIPAVPGVPTLASPSNSATSQPLTTSLTWNAVSGASTYRVQLSTSFTFANTIVDDSTVASALRAIGPLSTSMTYYWRVNAKNAGGTSAWSDIWSFSTVPPAAGAPTLVSPTNSATNQPLNFTLLWAAVSGASSYRVQVSTSSTFAGTVVDDSTLTSALKAIGPLSNGTTYYWHVNAKSAGGISAWSETWTFTTIPPPTAAPTLVSPSNAATNQPLSLSLTWNPVVGAVTYRVQLSTSSAFTGTVVDDSMLTSPSVPVGPLSSNSTYYWRVNTSNAGGASAWSTQWSFTTIPPVPNQVSLVTPLNALTIVVDSITFIWNKTSPIVDKYCLEIFTDSLANGRLLVDSTITDTLRIQKGLQNKTSYWWQVKAHNIAGWGASSGLRKFIINIPTVAVLPGNYSCVLNGMSKTGSIIRYGLPKASNVSIKLFSIQGKLLKIICNINQQAGYHLISIDYSGISGGFYLMDFRAGNYAVKRKINNFWRFKL